MKKKLIIVFFLVQILNPTLPNSLNLNFNDITTILVVLGKEFQKLACTKKS